MALSNEAKVGIFTSIGLVILLFATLYVADVTVISRGYMVNLVLDNAEDLKPKAKVKFGGGVVIGTVRDITITPDGKLNAQLLINKDQQVRKDAVFSMSTSGVMGEVYVNVRGGSDAADFLQANDTVYGSTSSGLNAAIANLNSISADFRSAMNELFKKGDLQNSVIKSVKYVEEMVKENKAAVGDSVKNFKKSSDDIAKAASDMKDVVAGLKKLTEAADKSNLPQTLDNINKISVKLDTAITSLQSAADKIDKGDGTLGVLINDKKMAEDLKSVVKEIKENPWKILWKK